jgi:hypothetical protein
MTEPLTFSAVPLYPGGSEQTHVRNPSRQSSHNRYLNPGSTEHNANGVRQPLHQEVRPDDNVKVSIISTYWGLRAPTDVPCEFSANCQSFRTNYGFISTISTWLLKTSLSWRTCSSEHWHNSSQNVRDGFSTEHEYIFNVKASGTGLPNILPSTKVFVTLDHRNTFRNQSKQKQCGNFINKEHFQQL